MSASATRYAPYIAECLDAPLYIHVYMPTHYVYIGLQYITMRCLCLPLMKCLIINLIAYCNEILIPIRIVIACGWGLLRRCLNYDGWRFITLNRCNYMNEETVKRQALHDPVLGSRRQNRHDLITTTKQAKV